MPPQPDPASVRSAPALSLSLTLFAGALLLAWMLIPRQDELVGRLVEDGRHDRALALLTGAASGTVTLDAEELIEFSADPGIGRDVRTLATQQLEWLVRNTDEPARLKRLLWSRRSSLPPEQLPQLFEALAIRAIHTNDPRLSAAIFEDLAELQPLDLDQTRQMVTACRYSGQPYLALEGISRFLKNHQVVFLNLPPDLRETTISLHREANQASRAFDRLAEEFHADTDPVSRKRLIELLTETGTQSNRVRDCLPLLQEFIESTEAGEFSWQELAGRNRPHPSDEDFVRYGSLLARILEWNTRSDEAFSLHAKLAVLGETESLERCATIYPWVNRASELTDLLQTLAPFSGPAEKYNLTLSHLLAGRGEFDAAESLCRSYLESGEHREEPEVWIALGEILETMNRFEEARDCYDRAMERDPGLQAVRVRLARLHTILGNFPAALSAYRDIPADQHDRKTREDYALLAESMDSVPDQVAAFRLKLESEPESIEPKHFSDLAEASLGRGETGAAEAVLREGLTHFPESRVLTINLADHLARTGDKAEAFEVLAEGGPESAGDPRAASRILDLGYELAQIERTIELLQFNSPADADWSASERFDMAEMIEAAGDHDRALAWYRSAGGEGAIEGERLQAEIAFARGDFASAATHQKRYLVLLPQPDHEAWLFLGDVLRESGQEQASEEAYRRALASLRIDLAKSPDSPGSDHTEKLP